MAVIFAVCQSLALRGGGPPLLEPPRSKGIAIRFKSIVAGDAYLILVVSLWVALEW